MSRTAPIINSFSKGELAPRLNGRTDLQHYFSAVETAENVLLMPAGGAEKTPGTHYVNRVKTIGQAARLINFEFSTTQAYTLLFNGGKMRVFKDRGQVLETAVNITGATQANPCVVTAVAHGYSNGDEVYIASVGGMTQLNGKYYLVANVTANTFELQTQDAVNVNSTSYGAYTSGGTVSRVYELAIPYAAADLAAIKWCQDDDLMYLFHPSYAQRKLTRSGHASWTLSTITYDANNWPGFRATNNTAITMTASAASGAITVTASSAFFTANHVGGHIRITTGYATITGYTSSTQVNATTVVNVGTGAQTDWAIGAWCAEYGYPSCGAFIEQRLAVAGTTSDPQGVWLSQTEQYDNFQTGSDDSDGMFYTIASNQVNAIKWAEPTTQLVLGTTGGPFNLGSGSNEAALTPTNVVVKQQTSYGCANIQAKKIGHLIYYAQFYGRRVREYGYNFNDDIYKASDITILSEHVTRSGVTEMTFQMSPYTVLWCVLANGQLATLTREADQEVYGWSRQYDASGTFENICVIPNPSGGYDEVWVVVKRNVGGQDVRYVEYFHEPFTQDTAQEDSFFVRSGLTYDGSPTSTVTGLDHLNGKTVNVLADGAPQNQKTVASGSITLDSAASVVHVGLPYTAKLKTLRLEAGSSNGTAQTKRKKIFDVFVRLWRTLGLNIGTGPSAVDEVVFRDTNMAMDTPPELFTGDKRVHFRAGWDRDGQIYIESSQPTPMTVLALIVNPMETSD